MTFAPAERLCVICDGPLQPAGGTTSRTCDRLQCRLAYRRHLELQRPVCTVCGRPLPGAYSTRAEPVCSSISCRLEHAQRRRGPSARRAAHYCTICKGPLPPHRVAVGVCDDVDCTAVQVAAHLREVEEQRLARLQHFREAATRLRDSQAASHGVEQTSEYSIAIVPHTSVPLGPAVPERVEKLRAHLQRLVETAQSRPPDSGDAPYQLSEMQDEASEVEGALFANACRLCRGHCCRAGAEHAFLSVKSIRDYLARFPEATVDEIVETYIRHIPDRSIVDSCVFHTETGCALPREIRSDMCNRWLCRGLIDVRTALAGGLPPKFYIASTGETDVEAAEFVNAGGDQGQ